MIQKVYLNGARNIFFFLSIFLTSHVLFAQDCASINLGNDVTICSGDSVTLSPSVNFSMQGYALDAVSQTGKMSDADKAEGAPDGYGAHFYRGCYSTYTRGIWEMPCVVPKNANLCFRVKVPRGTAMFKIWGVKGWGTSNVTYTYIATKYVSCTNYKDICVTSNDDYKYIKVQDIGGDDFYLDAISYEKTCTPTFAWSSGQSTESVTVNPTSTTSYILTAVGCGIVAKDTVVVNVTDCGQACKRIVGNTRGCASKEYVIWLKDKYGNAHHLDGDTTKYEWYEYSNGNVRFIAKAISASGLSGTFDIDLTFSGRTTTPPTNSPKYSSCFSVGSVSGWEYFTTTSGTITSTAYGTMSITRKGPAFQMGTDANITQSGFGASGWLNITGGNGYITTGDVNVMLSDCVQPDEYEFKICKGDSLQLCLDDRINIDSIYGSNMYTKSYTGTSTGGNFLSIATQYGTGEDCCDGSKPSKMVYRYVASNRIDHSQSNKSTITTYYQPAGQTALIVVNNSSSPNDTSGAYFRGVVAAGQTFSVLRNQQNKWQANHYIHIFSANGDSLLQLSVVHVSCSQPLISGEQFGTIVIESIEVNGTTCSGGSTECEATLTYIPQSGFTGLDTISYEVCNTICGNQTCTSFNIIIKVEDCDEKPGCERVVTDAFSCNFKKDYVVYLQDSHGSHHHLKGDSTKYQWLDYGDSARFVAKAISAPGLNGTFDVDIVFSGATTTPPTGSPKKSGCFDIGSASGWVYYPHTSGTITSTHYGNMTVTRRGEAFQLGYNANITDSGFGASGWLQITGGAGEFSLGDVNVMLSEECVGGGLNRIAGTIFFDRDRDTIHDSAEEVQKDVMVYLYKDANDNRELNDGEQTPIDSVLSDNNGNFEFLVAYDSCEKGYINNVTYQSSIDNPSNMLGEPDADYSGFDNNADNLIVELDRTIANGMDYTIYLGTIESGAYAIISESTDGVNFYHNTNIAILTSSSQGYTITADRDVKYIKFDKNTINSISGYNTNGSTSTNSYDYKIYGIEFCKGVNSYIVDTDLATYPGGSGLTTDNIETATFDGPNQEDLGNDFGFNGDVFIDGYVFHDEDSSGTRDNSETGTPNVTVFLYADLDHDGVLDANEQTPIASAETNSNGYYSFTRPYVADLSNLPDGLKNSYIINTDLNDYPSGSTLTTDNIEIAEFDSFAQEDLNNDFGHIKNGGSDDYCGTLEVTINKYKVAGCDTFENFPVYLDLSHNALKYQQDWSYSFEQGIFSPNGYDIKMTNEHGDDLPFEIVGYDSTNGRIQLWVNVDKLYSKKNTILYLHHGISSGGNITDPSSTGTWNSDYKAVYHFEDLKDATSNGNDATNYGASLVSGKLGSAYNFDGSSDYMKVPYSSSLDVGGKTITLSAWVRVDDYPSDDAPFVVKGPTVNQEAYMFGVDGGTYPVKINSRVTTNTGHYRDDAGALATSSWRYVQFVYDGNLGYGQKRVYVNGQLEYTDYASGSIKQGSDDVFIGKRLYSDNRYLDGKIDELRISSEAKSANWILTEFYNQKYCSHFAWISDSFGCGTVPVTWMDFDAKKVSDNDVQLTWATASELNNSHFEVERSFDAVNFETVGKPIKGAGTTTEVQRYKAMDWDLSEGVVYYRIKQIDYDGQFDYTPVRAVEVFSREIMVVYPNPAKDVINVVFEVAKNKDVQVMNATGQVIETAKMSSDGRLTINTADYPHGVYFIKVDSPFTTSIQKVVVEK